MSLRLLLNDSTTKTKHSSEKSQVKNVKAANVHRKTLKHVQKVIEIVRNSGYLDAKCKEIRGGSRFLHSTVHAEPINLSHCRL